MSHRDFRAGGCELMIAARQAAHLCAGSEARVQLDMRARHGVARLTPMIDEDGTPCVAGDPQGPGRCPMSSGPPTSRADERRSDQADLVLKLAGGVDSART